MPDARNTPEARNRSQVSKIVGPGFADSKRKGADARAKVQANADRVAAINADRAAVADRTADLASALVPAEGMSRKACVLYMQNAGIYSGHSRDGLPELQALVAEHQRQRASATLAANTHRDARDQREANLAAGIGAVLAGANPEAVADAMVADAAEREQADADRNQAAADADAARELAEVQGTDAEPRDPACADLLPADHAGERLALAQAEWAQLKAWRVSDLVGRGPRPCTPNLDAVNAEHNGHRGAVPTADGSPAPRAARSGTPTPRANHTARYTQALAVKAANPKRGAGTKVTDAELAAYVATVREQHPGAVRNQELEVAYYVAGLAVTRARWAAAWQAAELVPVG